MPFRLHPLKHRGANFQRQVDSLDTNIDDLDAQLTTGWHHAFGRAATPEQLSKSREFVHRQTALFKERKDKTPELTALANYCQALMSANKFVYVE